MRSLATALAVALLVCQACSGDTGRGTSGPATPAGAVPTLSPLPMPDSGPPPGRLVADLRQSSRDVALGRFQVWIGNGLARPVTPTRIRYLDPRLRRPLDAGRLRPDPSGSERGYTLPLPRRPRCAAPAGAARAEITWAGDSVTVPVEDEAEVVTRHVRSRCVELAVARIATLSFADAVPVTTVRGRRVGTLTLRVRPTGRRGRLRILAVTGSPLLTSAPGASWEVDRRVRGGGRPASIALPVVQARCDGHVFMEAAGATAFRVSVVVDGRPGDVLVRMRPAGAAAAIGFAADACGL